ncbi:MAG: type II toxin-antitoxin system RelE/ParE family toxin [Deltaproteobacteria bacterium]|nr:type II toxin-antitoxin system RelE/ParE family toxin [Deltaproteobacteria bacterium]
MPCEVPFASDAAGTRNHSYSPDQAEYILGKIERDFYSLSASPHRGACPRELLALGIKEYREIFFKPYRIIYRVVEKQVFAMVIVDGRRDMRTLLERRLLGVG